MNDSMGIGDSVKVEVERHAVPGKRDDILAVALAHVIASQVGTVLFENFGEGEYRAVFVFKLSEAGKKIEPRRLEIGASSSDVAGAARSLGQL